MTNYHIRGVHVVRGDNGLEFQVLTYGVADPGADAVEARLEKRGMDVRVMDLESRYCDDKFSFGEGRKPRGRGHEEPAPRHFFNRRIEIGRETVQAGHYEGRVRTRDGESGQVGEQPPGSEEGRDRGGHKCERRRQ